MKAYFRVETFRPDQRQYRQTSLALSCLYDDEVIVELEIPDEFVVEVSELHIDEDENHKTRIITLAGLRELADQFDLVFLPSSPSKQYNQSEKKDEWEDEN